MPKFEENIPLAQFSNYRIGGPAKFFFKAGSSADIEWAVAEAKKRRLNVFILGGGTNLLFRDEGYNGLVLKPALNFLKFDGGKLTAGAGIDMAELLNFAAKNGASGLEWAGGLPGTLGGAIRGNAGCFGGEIKDSIVSAESFDTENSRKITRENPDCRFTYRSSVFKEKDGKEIILSAVFSLKKGNPETIGRAIREKIDYRLSRHPMEYPNAGSIFKNVDLKKMPKEFQVRFARSIKLDPVPVIPTARLISEAGLKGVSYGGAMISPKHANFIVNVLDAKASDVKKLISLTKREIKKRFKVELEEEIMEV